MKISVFVAFGTLILFLGGCKSPGSSIVKVEPDVMYSSLDELNKDFATRAQKFIGPADNFKVIPTVAVFPVGTVMHAGTSIPISAKACSPIASPLQASAPNLFPVYGLSKTAALEFGLDNAVIQQLADFGIALKDSDQVLVTVKQAKIETLTDDDIKEILSKADCKTAISTSPVWFIRGYMLGQRNLQLKNENAKNIKGKVEKIASFNVDAGSGSESLSLSDEGESKFLQIVSQVAISEVSQPSDHGPAGGGMADSGRPGPARSVFKSHAHTVMGNGRAALLGPQPTIAIEKPKVSSSTGRVFVQSDYQDTSDKDELIVKDLRSASFNVESTIDRIKSSLMPRVAEVRYFNEADKDVADRALQEVRKTFPSATTVRVALPAPSGQLEVWLPRINN